MSEFSESYHLRSDATADAVALLKQAGLPGFAYQSTNGWVTFVAEQGTFEPDRRIFAAAAKPLLHYVSAEDHGWNFTLFDRTQAVCSYSCEWDDEIRYDRSGYSRPILDRIVPSLDPDMLDAFEDYLEPQDFADLQDVTPAIIFAEALRLTHYSWLSYSYLHRDWTDSPTRHPNVTQVS